MKPARWTVGPDDSLGRAERITADGKLVGIVSYVDALRALAA